MVEERTWQVENEGNLARTWEQRLRPKVSPQPQRRRRIAARWVRPAAWIGALWGGAVVASFLAIQVMTMSYHYDQTNQQYAALTRQNQSLNVTLAALTSTQALSRDAARLKVTMVEPASALQTPVKHGTSKPVAAPTVQPSALGRVTRWMQNLSQSLGQ
ncbi:hypothetical protein [Sulfobacillus harzensis]|uniref:Cell division protein FtsL n=1 Tax=Sulfobacillus harzensis TaxID=2729629 RepID=A0A7Y0L240_9FIRM|nr:hypothetical protein [Sulfobacillus harzensis]NMP21607.1 hypothetical protein [Sulfobacillus harzensis]